MKFIKLKIIILLMKCRNFFKKETDGKEVHEQEEAIRMKNRVLLGAFLCLIASMSWGAMFPVADAAFYYIDPFYFTIIRYVSVTVILVVLLYWREGRKSFRLEGKGWPLWFFGTMAFTVYNLLIFWGQDLLGEPGIMVASVMESLMPMISVVIVWLLFKNRPHIITISCVVLAFVGATLVITEGNIFAFFTGLDGIIPSLLTFIAVIGWVVYTMGGERFAGWSALRYSTLSCLLGTATALLVVIIVTFTGYISVPTVKTMITVIPHMSFMVIFAGVIALVGWNVGIGILSPLNGLLFINFVPVTTIAVSYMQGNTVTIYDYIGATFIIISLIGNNIFLRYQTRHLEQTPEKEVQVDMQEEPANI